MYESRARDDPTSSKRPDFAMEPRRTGAPRDNYYLFMYVEDPERPNNKFHSFSFVPLARAKSDRVLRVWRNRRWWALKLDVSIVRKQKLERELVEVSWH